MNSLIGLWVEFFVASDPDTVGVGDILEMNVAFVVGPVQPDCRVIASIVRQDKPEHWVGLAVGLGVGLGRLVDLDGVELAVEVPDDVLRRLLGLALEDDRLLGVGAAVLGLLAARLDGDGKVLARLQALDDLAGPGLDAAVVVHVGDLDADHAVQGVHDVQVGLVAVGNDPVGRLK